MKHLTIKKYIITIALAITSALFVVFGLCMPKNNIVARAIDAEILSSDFYIHNTNLVRNREDGASEYALNPFIQFAVGSDYSSKLGTVNRGHIKFDLVHGYTDRKEITSIYLVRTDDFSLYTSSVKNFVDPELMGEEIPKDYFTNTEKYTYPHLDSLQYDGDEFINAVNYSSDNVDVDKKYYYFLILGKKTIDKNKTTTNTQFTQLAKSTNYVYTSYKELCEKVLKSDRFDNATSSNMLLKSYRNLLGYSTDEGNVNVVLKYKNTINRSADEINAVTENYQVENLKSLSKTYVYDTVMQLCGKSSLSDFNVVRQEVGYTVNGDSDSAFLQDEYTLLEANGYEYVFNKDTNQGELTITYGDFAAKDFTLTVRTNDDLHSVLFIRSGDIKTAGGTTTITFDTSNIKTRL